MRNGFFAISLLMAFNLSAQGNLSPKDAKGKKHGEWRKLYDNNKIRYTGTFEHGIPVNTFHYYFSKGDLQTTNVFRGKTGNCYSLQYGDGKQLAAEGLYSNKDKDSTWTYYNAEGRLVGRENYRNGTKEGPLINYYPTGKIAETLNYEKGKKTGEWRQYYESGEPMAKGTYLNGSLQGPATYFFTTGKPRLKGSYVKGLMDGNWYHFDTNMKVKKKEVWRRGRLVKDKKEEKIN
jgi:antitoxin component YwqK of YwqJK toxin-antitoxin module